MLELLASSNERVRRRNAMIVLEGMFLLQNKLRRVAGSLRTGRCEETVRDTMTQKKSVIN
eukprot:629007-Rhodomonas_salina.3